MQTEYCPECGKKVVAVIEDWDIGVDKPITRYGYCTDNHSFYPRKFFIHAEDD